MTNWVQDNWAAIVKMGPLAAKDTPCAVKGCDRVSSSHGLCHAHYQRARSRFDLPYRKKMTDRRREKRHAAAASSAK